MLVLPMRDGSRYKEWLLIAELQRDKSLQGAERGGIWPYRAEPKAQGGTV